MKPSQIDNYRFGNITINGRTYQKDVIIFPHRVFSNWRREQGHSLSMKDLQEVIAMQPKILIVGTGMFGRMLVSNETLAALKAAGLEVVIEKTERACHIYNQRKDDDDVIAALHLTC